MFTELPSGFPKLLEYAHTVDGSIPPPANLYSIGEKVYFSCTGKTPAELLSLRASIRRKIPYAMWLDNHRDINNEPSVVDWYYENLSINPGNISTRTKRILTPLLHKYISCFNPDLPAFIRLANNLKLIAKAFEANDVPLLHLAELHELLGFFDPKTVGIKTATEYLTGDHNKENIDQWFNSFGLWPEFVYTSLGLHIYKSALQLNSEIYRNIRSIKLIINWTGTFRHQLPTEHKVYLANALLTPWISEDPAEETKLLITNACISTLSDPRLDSFYWQAVKPQAKSVLLRWLTGRTLNVFFDVLRNTADNIWKYRQEFWTRYYRQGYITEAWAVLGPQAHQYLVRNNTQTTLSYGRLIGQNDDGQSVLLMRIGDFVFCEWSHNGKLRVTTIDAETCPKLYGNAYQANNLRFPSMHFISNTGHIHDDGLPHLSSDSNWWQNTAQRFIRNKVGI